MSSAEAELDHAARAGATVHRLTLSWRGFQASPDAPPLPEAAPGNTVERVDTFYAAALQRGITPIFIAYSAPLWATRYQRCGLLDFGCTAIANSEHKLVPEPAYLDDYERFVAAVKSRWPRALIESWNEPNLYWDHPSYRGSKAFAASPEHFAQIQCAAYRGSKSVNNDPVLAAGWAFNRYEPYLTRVYAAGGASCWDLANLHVYTGVQTSFGAGTNLASIFDTTRRMRTRFGDTDPIWITETGFTTTGGRLQALTFEDHADAARRLYNRMSTMPDVGGVLFHTLRDGQRAQAPYNDPESPEYGYGFLHADWTPKPVYCHFAAKAGNTAPGC